MKDYDDYSWDEDTNFELPEQGDEEEAPAPKKKRKKQRMCNCEVCR